MAGVFAGFAKSLTAETPKVGGKAKSQHEVFISTQVLPLTIKLQKEMRGRRYTDVQGRLQESVTALTKFRDVEWLPGKAAAAAAEKAPPTPSGSPSKTDLSVVSDTESTLTDATDEASTENGSSPAVSATTTTAATTTAAGSDHLTQITEEGEEEGGGGGSNSHSNSHGEIMEDDPQTREPVHRAVTITMEAYAMVLGHDVKTNRGCELAMDGMHMLVSKQYFSGRAGGKDDSSGSGSKAAAAAKKDGTELPPASLMHRLVESIAKTSESNVDIVQTAVVRTLRAITTSPKCGVHESTMLLALRSTFHVYLVTKTPACKQLAKEALLDTLRSVFFRMEAYDVMARGQARKIADAVGDANPKSVDEPAPASSGEGTATDASPVEEGPAAFPSQYHTDSYVLLGSLCKMCSKELPVDVGSEPDTRAVPRLFNTQVPTDPLALNSKILSLELILSALDYCGDAFFEGEKFIYLVQNYLCVALLKNCVSSHTQVAFLSQKIFLVLVHKFKGHLKQEIEVFLSKIFLRVLDSPNSSFKQKALVLESLRSLCKDPVLLTQIFLNYDCDFDAKNLYKDIVHILTKLGGKTTSAPTPGLSKKDAEEEYELSLAGMEVLVTILKAFLRALGLPGGDLGDDDTAGERIRGILDIDIGLAAKPIEPKDTIAESVTSDEQSLGSRSRNMADPDDTSSADAAGKIVDAFEMKRNAEQNFELGAVKFTLSLKSGLNFFIDNDFVERDAKAIALFFITNKDTLDKTQMGEVLGREPDAAFVKGDGIDPEKGGPGFYVRILHHYADALGFTGMMFDDAIRLFLSGFRLPGEAQKIDRIMEKFAEKFTNQNPDVFPSADTAFILAFSVIMLNTDLHNPSIKEDRRMTAESFIRNNRGIAAEGGDLPDDVLTGIFNRIKELPFSLKEDDAVRERMGGQKQMFEAAIFFEGSTFFGTSADDRKREKFKKERDEMMSVTEQLILRRPEKNSKSTIDTTKRLTDNVAPADVVKPMFDVTWGPMIGILSQVLECMDDERSVAVCLNGFVYAVRIASHSSMSLARDTFISSLAKFTFLGSLKEMKWKNVESIRTLLSIAVIDGEYLGESWGPVLQCISQLARLRLTASGLDSDESFLVEKDKAKKVASTNRAIDLFAEGGLFPAQGIFRQVSKGEVAREAEESNGRAVLEAVQEVLLDKVFSSTVNLSAKSLAHFIQELIAVSASEIEGNTKSGITGVDASKIAKGGNKSVGPSIFSLQRLVEVADCNMNVRPRLVWAQVWEVMADYFAKIACHENSMVSVFAIDSLKQLSFKFLEKPELSEFNFQRTFLKPFLAVMEDKGSREDIRELVLWCVDNIIRTKSHNLRSGWKIVFSILTRSAGDPSVKIDNLGLSILQRLLDEHLHELCQLTDKEPTEDHALGLSPQDSRNRNANVDDFVELCRASLAFIQKEEADSPRPIGLSIRALCHTAIYADLIADKRVHPPMSGAQWTDPNASGFTYEGLSEKEGLEMVLWRHLLQGLVEGVRSTARSTAGGVGCLVQRGSLLALRAIFLRHGDQFSTTQWAAILEQTLLPAIRAGAENDFSPVVGIISESPSVSSVDFLVESPPLPPPADDMGLLKFEALNATPNRSLGPAELLLEASFTDLRHGGDGNLRRAYVLAKLKASDVKILEQPFPDSWLVTAAPVALGLLTDIASEIVLHRGEEGRQKLWPIIESQYKLWCLGYPPSKESANSGEDRAWRPCEALVRISCREIRRFPLRVAEILPELSETEATSWTSLILKLFTEIISENAASQHFGRQELVELKQKALVERNGKYSDSETLDDEEVIVNTLFGRGRLLKKRTDKYSEGGVKVVVEVDVIALDSGATLYRPATGLVQALSSSDEPAKPFPLDVVPFEINVPNEYWQELVPELKVRCVTAYCAQHSLVDVLDRFVFLLQQDQISTVLDALNMSRLEAEAAVDDEDVLTAFQEALLSEWGDGVAVVEEALDNAARLSHLHGSAMFFLAQEAGATQGVIYSLSKLYQGGPQRGYDGGWDRECFAEPQLLGIMKQVLDKFLASEEKDGHLIDPNVWRNASESGGKVALYCTSFAPVVVEIIKIIASLKPEQFAKHKQDLFPAVCMLIRIQSEEIRHLVQEVFVQQVAPMLGVQLN